MLTYLWLEIFKLKNSGNISLKEKTNRQVITGLQDDIEAHAEGDDEEAEQKYQLQEVPRHVSQHGDVVGKWWGSTQHKNELVPVNANRPVM